MPARFGEPAGSVVFRASFVNQRVRTQPPTVPVRFRPEHFFLSEEVKRIDRAV